ncbi:MAG: hypothetical protein M3O09_04410 [Acidobacteriota bacterium]|nr:hypothetical protein [Acidobacteriota bacterium]
MKVKNSSYVTGVFSGGVLVHRGGRLRAAIAQYAIEIDGRDLMVTEKTFKYGAIGQQFCDGARPDRILGN